MSKVMGLDTDDIKKAIMNKFYDKLPNIVIFPSAEMSLGIGHNDRIDKMIFVLTVRLRRDELLGYLFPEKYIGVT